MTATLINNYFPGLTLNQKEQFETLASIYAYWNDRINVISRKDFSNFYLHHVLHSLGIARVTTFVSGTAIIDVGTGGGFPGIPLAILFPDCRFLLADSIGKKINVVREAAASLGLQNVEAVQSRAENLEGNYDFVVSRAVTNLPDFVRLTAHLVHPESRNSLPNGILYLKGGDFQEELGLLRGYRKKVFALSEYFREEFFVTKKVVHLCRGC